MFRLVHILPILLLVTATTSQQEGWKMTDRFYGFRFSITGPAVHNVGLRNHIVSISDKYSCFGWVQNVQRPKSKEQTQEGKTEQEVVGEVRCAKKYGKIVEGIIRNGPYTEAAVVEGVEVKVYDDTKIKLHFSHFKILNDDRKTCFRDSPHMCEEFNVVERVDDDVRVDTRTTTGQGGNVGSTDEL
mmetsp:Transcript_22947/g.47577  ORF Transcript_22947/g.47577 Transcript_22947/m.47577 type:complete len:186 (-) Transcript_22947:46-603(-)